MAAERVSGPLIGGDESGKGDYFGPLGRGGRAPGGGRRREAPSGRDHGLEEGRGHDRPATRAGSARAVPRRDAGVGSTGVHAPAGRARQRRFALGRGLSRGGRGDRAAGLRGADRSVLEEQVAPRERLSRPRHPALPGASRRAGDGRRGREPGRPRGLPRSSCANSPRKSESTCPREPVRRSWSRQGQAHGASTRRRSSIASRRSTSRPRRSSGDELAARLRHRQPLRRRGRLSVLDRD